MGAIDATGVFRDLPVVGSGVSQEEILLGDQAIAFIDEIEATAPADFVEDITNQNLEEVTKGYADGPFTRDDLDRC